MDRPPGLGLVTISIFACACLVPVLSLGMAVGCSPTPAEEEAWLV